MGRAKKMRSDPAVEIDYVDKRSRKVFIKSPPPTLREMEKEYLAELSANGYEFRPIFAKAGDTRPQLYDIYLRGVWRGSRRTIAQCISACERS